MNADPRDPRAAVWLAVAQLCSADEKKTAVRYSPAFVDALSHVVYAQAETMGGDLECFAKHARRAKVTVDDVKRSSPDLYCSFVPAGTPECAAESDGPRAD